MIVIDREIDIMSQQKMKRERNMIGDEEEKEEAISGKLRVCLLCNIQTNMSMLLSLIAQ